MTTNETKRNPEVYQRYSQKRPQFPFRVPKDKRDEVEQVRTTLGLGKQDFMNRIFELGFPLLQSQLTSENN